MAGRPLVTDPARRLAPVVRLAPAKLNLTLAVVGRRPDGYHALHSVVVPLALADRLSLAVAPGAREDSLHVVRTARRGRRRTTSVLRAVAATRRAAAPLAGGPAALPPLAARLDKRIPVAAGLGGGSSDAAAAIDGALEAWAPTSPRRRGGAWPRASARTCPFFLAGGPALIEGRGEDGHAAARRRSATPPGVLLVTPAVPVSTADVFAAFAAGAAGRQRPARRA